MATKTKRQLRSFYVKTNKLFVHCVAIHITYNYVFKRLMGYQTFGSASGMFVKNKIDHLNAGIRRYVYGFFKRSMFSEKSIVTYFMNTSAWFSLDLYRNWNKCHYISKMIV